MCGWNVGKPSTSMCSFLNVKWIIENDLLKYVFAKSPFASVGEDEVAILSLYRHILHIQDETERWKMIYWNTYYLEGFDSSPFTVVAEC